MKHSDKVEEYLRDRFHIALQTANESSTRPFQIDEPITEQEAKFFLLGLEESLFAIDDAGYVQSPLLPGPRKNQSTQRMYQMFWHFGDGTRRLFREGVNQLATACRMIVELGWHVEEIKMEPSDNEYGSLAYAVDIIAVTTDGTIPLCCENKRNASELRRMVKNFRTCCEMGEHTKTECPNRINHPKYAFCLESRAKFIWFVSPTEEVCFRLSYGDSGFIGLSEIYDLPSRTDILSVQA